jgi:hypothetical protein
MKPVGREEINYPILSNLGIIFLGGKHTKSILVLNSIWETKNLMKCSMKKSPLNIQKNSNWRCVIVVKAEDLQPNDSGLNL